MKKGTTVGCMAVFAGVLLATVTAVSADHAAQGKGNVSVAPNVSSQFQFVVARQLEGSDLKPGLNFVQFEMTRVGGPMSFQTFMMSTAIAPFEISDDPITGRREVKIEGELVSTTFPGVRPARQPFEELVHFTAVGTDNRALEEGADLFSMTVEYSATQAGATQAQGPLFASLGFGRCDATICRITFDGEVEMGDGNVFVHTSGGE
jgi:hypothetical protein